MVARQLGRRAIGLDLSFAYLQKCAKPRLSLDALEDWTAGKAAGNGHGRKRKPKETPAQQAELFTA
jgi:hypothetical protein